MNRFIIIMSLVLSSLAVSAHNHKHECNHDHESEAVAENPQQYVQVVCPNCGGAKLVVAGYDYWGNTITVPCALCQGRGWIVQLAPPPQQSNNPSFRGNTYYAECCHHKFCKMFVPEKTGSAKCKTCGCLKKAHVIRTM